MNFKAMPLVVGQIVYSSFPNVGYQTFATSEIPEPVQSAFVEDVVHEYWDVYEPPPQGYKAGFIHQVDAQHILFGWLFNDGGDDYGRLHTPYCLGYYQKGDLAPECLDRILDCLCKGPVHLISRQVIPDQIETIEIAADYEPATPGVMLTTDQYAQLQQQVQQQQLLKHLFSETLTAAPLTTNDPVLSERQPEVVLEPPVSVVAAQSAALSRSRQSVPAAGRPPGQQSRQRKAAQRAELASQIISILDETL